MHIRYHELDKSCGMYKSAYILSQTSHYGGKGAASFKKYITISTINIISELLDISADMSMVMQYAQSIFNDYADNNGAVEEGVLDYINKTLESKKIHMMALKMN